MVYGIAIPTFCGASPRQHQRCFKQGNSPRWRAPRSPRRWPVCWWHSHGMKTWGFYGWDEDMGILKFGFWLELWTYVSWSSCLVLGPFFCRMGDILNDLMGLLLECSGLYDVMNNPFPRSYSTCQKKLGGWGKNVGIYGTIERFGC